MNTLPDQIAKQRSRVFLFARRFTYDTQLAEDLTQDVIIKALTHTHQFQEGTSLNAWLYTMTRNTFINNYRNNKRKGDYFDIDILVRYDSQNERTGFKNSDFSSYYELAIQPTAFSDMEVERIDKAIKKLPKNFRKSVQLRSLGYSYEEIAKKQKIPVGTVKSKIFRARQVLQSKI